MNALVKKKEKLYFNIIYNTLSMIIEKRCLLFYFDIIK